MSRLIQMLFAYLGPEGMMPSLKEKAAPGKREARRTKVSNKCLKILSETIGRRFIFLTVPARCLVERG
jgi:hypothetical protein